MTVQGEITNVQETEDEGVGELELQRVTEFDDDRTVLDTPEGKGLVIAFTPGRSVHQEFTVGGVFDARVHKRSDILPHYLYRPGSRTDKE